MQSLRDAVQTAIDRKRMPLYVNTNSTNGLGVSLGVPTPVSLESVITALDALPAAGVWYGSGPVTAGYVHGSAKVWLQSDGLTSYQGDVHEAGAAGDNYVFMMIFPDIKDASGKTLVFAKSGNVAGQLNFGDSNDHWQNDSFVSLIQDRWDALKSTRFQWYLHVASDPFQVTETVLLGVLIAAGIVIGSMLLVGNSSDSNVECGPHKNGADDPGDMGCTYRVESN
jgi:hypothetical protein